MRRSCILLTISLLLAGVHGARGQGFSFLHITDTHVGAAGREQALGHLAAAVGRMSPKPAFVVNTGDLTDLGTPEQLRRYAELASALTVPSHAVPGSHDVRWSPTVKAGFEATVGPRHRSFQHGGCHFVLLDSTIALSHRGHIDRAQLRWLQGDLRRLRRGTPVFVFVHHPVGRMPRQIENEDELLRILAPYRVAALFAGHGHADAAWTVNGIPVFMARGLHEGSYHRVEVGDEKVRVLRAIEGPDRPVEIASLPLAGRPAASVAFAWDDAQVPLLARRRFVAELRDERGRATDDRVTAEYAIGGAAPQPMERDARDKESVSFMAQFATRELVAGAHALTVLLTAADGVVYRREESFVVERLQGEPRFAWETPFPAGDAVRSSVAPSSNGVVFGSLDGRLTSLSIGHGRRRWVASTRAPVVGSPAVHDGVVFVGSTDGGLYAFDERSGRQRWRFDTGGPLLATPAVSGEVVCIGGNGMIWGVDRRTGRERWRVEAGSFFQSRAAVAGGVFFLGGWDNAVHAIDAATGRRLWRTEMGRADGGRGELSFRYAPAIASPAVADGRVYIASNDGVLHALDAATGNAVWTSRPPEGGDRLGHSSPLVASGRVIVAGVGPNGDCYAFDAATGALVWRRSTGAAIYEASPVLSGDRVVIGSAAGRLFWIDAASGELRGSFGLPAGLLLGTPAVVDGRVVAATMAGRVWAVSGP